MLGYIGTCTSASKVFPINLYLTATCVCVHLKCSLVWVEKNAVNTFFTDKKMSFE